MAEVLIVALLGSGLCTALLIPLVRDLALKKGWVDEPDNLRKLHHRATPNIGGLAIAAGFFLGAFGLVSFQEILPVEIPVLPMGLWFGALVMIGAGFYDDIWGMSFKGKFALQVVVAYGLIHAGYRIDVADLPFVEGDFYQQALYSIPLTMLWIVGVINAVNLLDGLDGLAGGVVAIAFGCLALVFGFRGELGLVLLALPIIGALVGFLYHNFNPASIFMGDSGSLFIGFLLAAYSLQGQAHSDPLLAILVPVVALGLPVLDTGLSIVRRLASRKAICAPDSDHIHHRLVRHGSPRRAVLLLYAAAAVFGALAVMMALSTPGYGYGLFGMAVVLAGAGLQKLGYMPAYAALREMWRREKNGSLSGALICEGSGDGHAGAAPEQLVASVSRNDRTIELGPNGAEDSREGDDAPRPRSGGDHPAARKQQERP